MSHNPNTVKSQSELNPCNDGKRSSEVLLSTIEELEKTKKQLDIAKKYLKWIIDTTEEGHICCDACGYPIECKGCENEEWAKDALKEIEELNK